MTLLPSSESTRTVVQAKHIPDAKTQQRSDVFINMVGKAILRSNTIDYEVRYLVHKFQGAGKERRRKERKA